MAIKILSVLCFLLVIAFLLRLAIPKLSSQTAASGIVLNAANEPDLGDCPDTPNCQSSTASRTDQQVSSIAFSDTATPELITKIAQLLGERQTGLHGFKVVTKDEHYLHAIVQTRIFGFIDDVEFLVKESQIDEKQGLIQIRSASRLGVSDLGANKKRVERIVSIISDQL